VIEKVLLGVGLIVLLYCLYLAAWGLTNWIYRNRED